MKLSEVFQNIDADFILKDQEIRNIRNNSKLVETGDLYVAIRGTNVDGHQFVRQALEQGACAVVVDHDMSLDRQIVVRDTKKAYALLCSNYFGNPSQKLKLVGVTGTNGKTSTTTIIKNVLEAAGLKTGLIGTIQIEYGDVVKPNPNTTPDAYMFHQTLKEMVDAGCKYAVSEISSHALAQDRIYGCSFEVCVFTNLTQDHLDYHKDMEDYFSAKKKLFPMGKYRVINIHDAYGKRLAAEFPENLVTFSISDPNADFYASDIQCTTNAVCFRMTHQEITSKIHFAIPGLYSVENAMAAVSVCRVLGISAENIINALGKMKGIRGRSEIIFSNDRFMVVCDYAHTPDGIENVLQSLKAVSKGRLVAVFGCGGDRDKTKRPLMAAASEKYADFIIVTSDNPRSEDPESIIADILPGFSPKAQYVKYTDRTEAIRYAMEHAQQDDIVVLLGKGHETYQILKDKTIHYDEREVVAALAQELKLTAE
jgi:UDP-N-acetylmuramoyl-L-alanyl-D-glutamate--2,6-diaminopimelate ligase